MEINESPAPLAPQGDDIRKSSPFHPRNLFNLFFRPRRFFEQLPIMEHSPYIYLCAWFYGIVSVMQRIERMSMDPRTSVQFTSWEQLTSSWLHYWLWPLLLGVLNAVLTWIVGGWWYRLRIRWSGDDDSDPFVVRLIYFYSGAIFAIPILLQVLLYTLLYPNYETASLNASPWTAILLVLPFWGVIVGYIGVRACFHTRKWHAILWIVALPFLQYGFGIFALIMSFLVEM